MYSVTNMKPSKKVDGEKGTLRLYGRFKKRSTPSDPSQHNEVHWD